MILSDSFDDQTWEGVSIGLNFKESLVGKTDQEMEMDRYSIFVEQKYFLICNSCFWCASYFKNRISFSTCPVCINGKIDCMPIGEDENYTFNLSLTKGIELEFSNDIQVS